MASEEQIEILRQGVVAWNKWREQNSMIKPDLSKANLHEAKFRKIDLLDPDLHHDANFRWTDLFKPGLRGADLSDADLHEADLREADLYKANLTQANLRGAKLIKAALIEAELYKADLSCADLRAAELQGASLIQAKLCEADLRGAKLTEADLTDADLGKADLREADLYKANLYKAKLSGADIEAAKLTEASLFEAVLSGANLTLADLNRADLTKAKLNGAILRKADLREATLREATLSGVDLSGANLTDGVLVETNLENANLNGCKIYGISAWNVIVNQETKQSDLVITRGDEPAITVDELEIAQFIYLLLNNDKVRHVIDAVTSKVVLILGRFTEERKAVLDAMREELRRRNLTPILFDFDKPASKDLTGTVETLARMARFVIADLTDPSSIPHELATVVPFLRTTPVLPLRLIGTGGYTIFDDLRAYTWVLPIHEYKDGTSLISTLPEVIAPADAMAEKLRKAR